MSKLNPSVKIARKKFAPTLRKKAILRALGLPFSAHWDDAYPKLKDLIIRARLENNDNEAAFLSLVKVFLKKNLYRECYKCKITILGKHRHCKGCGREFKEECRRKRILSL